ncbi:MAG: LamG domain-containing protein [Kiritimatiellae bacterium]|nr:LamG domain-containing protein [Kiritimatiellia bacterium]
MNANRGWRHAWALSLALVGSVVAQESPPTNGLVLYMPLDSADGGGWTYDTTTNKFRARAVEVRWTSIGRVNGACEFLDTGSFLAVSNPIVSGPQWSLTMWFRIVRVGDAPRTLLERDATTGLVVQVIADPADSNRHGRLRWRVGGAEAIGDVSVDDKRWHHFALVADGQRVRAWIDAVAQTNSVEWGAPLPATPPPWIFGMNRSAPGAAETNRSWNGVMDELRIYDRALSAAEIEASRAAVKSRFTRAQVQQRIREIQELYDRGLLMRDFYERKMAECEADL